MAKLYVVATPIGNLSDMTPRAIETLRSADLIAAEDTRVTRALLNHFGIDTPCISNHQHNEEQRASSLPQRMLDEDLTVAVVTDAGTPCISDPGSVLVREAAALGIEVLAVIFSRRLGMTVGTFVMTYNALLYVVAGVIMGSWVLPLYSIVTYAIGIKAVDFIVEGLDKTKAAMIITDHPQDICRELSAAFGTGITLIDAHGYYSGDSKTMIYFVVNRFQIARMRTIVHDIDAQAFISITEVSDLFGKNAK